MKRLLGFNDVTGLRSKGRKWANAVAWMTGALLSQIALAAPARGQDADPTADGQTSNPSDNSTSSAAPTSFNDLRRQINQDLANQRTMLAARRNDLVRWDAAAQQTFQAAFGTTDPAARQQVLVCIDRELTLNSQLSANNFRQATTTDPTLFAYVHANDPSTIYLGPRFATAPAVGQNSRAGTLVHEMSHFDNVCATQDDAYGVNNAATLSSGYANGMLPFQPWRNADNVEYYVEGVLGQPSAAGSPTTADRTQLVMDDSARSDIARYAYNPPADIVGANNTPRGPRQPGNSGNAVPANAAPQMTDEQFRVFLAVTMRRFQEQAPAQEQSLRNRPTLPAVSQGDDDPAQAAQAPATDDDDSNGQPDSARLVYDEYAPRNGYNAQGNRADSPRQRYDAQGYYRTQPGSPAPVRQNRVYSIDGSSRPIGQRVSQALPTDSSNLPVSGDPGLSQAPAARDDDSAQPAQAPVAGDDSAQAPATGNDADGQPDSARLTYDDYAPRNGYDAQGDRADSPRQRYDAQGYYRSQPGNPAPVRQNRVYSIDGSSRPIGRSRNNAAAAYGAIQRQAYRQIAAQQGGGSYSVPGYGGNSSGGSGTSAPSSAGPAGYSTSGGQPAPSARLVYDDSAPRQAVPSQPVVAPRQPGVRPAGAGTSPLPAVAPRQPGTAPRTAGIAPLN